ncbi:unnamed protein product [Phytophthora lilii]|uniref:Unnamed protein product n=1 Tax=Phytophthora lilii TaxID=2077276 RepID=A0A9W6U0W1_9STRA|nr:unnamed protein product [Phytophthora lilii]
MDGTSGVTQCHISPNKTADYRFKPEKTGTFWWHNHESSQFAFGLKGPLIMRAPTSAQQVWEKDIAGEFTIQLSDYYHAEPGPVRMWDNMLINNRGRYNCTAAASHGFTDYSDDQPLSKFHFQAGNKYLLRLINLAALSPIIFSIDDHEFQVLMANHFSLQNPSNLSHLTAGIATICYRLYDLGEFEFTPLVSVTLPSSPQDRTILEFKMQSGLGYFAIDGEEYHHFVAPSEPPAIAKSGGWKQLPIDANTRKIEYGKHVEIVLVNVKDEQHSFHMHGHAPWVVGSGVASIDAIRRNELPPQKLVNPMIRDVYNVAPCTSDGRDGCRDAGYLILRFDATNPGVWIMHCHIDWVEGEELLQQKGVGAFSNSILSVCGGMQHTINSTSSSEP